MATVINSLSSVFSSLWVFLCCYFLVFFFGWALCIVCSSVNSGQVYSSDFEQIIIEQSIFLPYLNFQKLYTVLNIHKFGNYHLPISVTQRNSILNTFYSGLLHCHKIWILFHTVLSWAVWVCPFKCLFFPSFFSTVKSTEKVVCLFVCFFFVFFFFAF